MGRPHSTVPEVHEQPENKGTEENMRTPGYIYLHRQLLDNPIVCKDSDHFAIWIYFLLKANHASHEILFNGKRIILKRGQFITGRKIIAKKMKLNESKVYRIIKLFKSEQQTEQLTDSTSSLITILNYGGYQKMNSKVNSKRTASEQQVNTDNKYKVIISNEKKRESKNIQLKNIKNSFKDLKKKFPDVDVAVEYDKYTDWMSSKGITYKDYTAAFRNWLRRSEKGFTKKADKVEFSKTPTGLWKAYCSKCSSLLFFNKLPYPNTSSECCGTDIFNYDPKRVSA